MGQETSIVIGQELLPVPAYIGPTAARPVLSICDSVKQALVVRCHTYPFH